MDWLSLLIGTLIGITFTVGWFDYQRYLKANENLVLIDAIAQRFIEMVCDDAATIHVELEQQPALVLHFPERDES